MGYLHFLDLREEQKQREENEFDLREFHKRILEITDKGFNLFVEYRQLLQKFMADCYVANQKSIEYLNKKRLFLINH